MKPTPFDATVDLLAHHLDHAGVPEAQYPEALATVREGLGALPGAGWVDVDYRGRMDPRLLGPRGDRWLTPYRPGNGTSPEPEGPWQDKVRGDIEVAMKRALKGLLATSKAS